jgi:predicted MFS family arabinose efflux permease
VGNAAIDGTYIGSMMGWRWTVVGAVVIVVVVVVVVVAVAIAATAHH